VPVRGIARLFRLRLGPTGRGAQRLSVSLWYEFALAVKKSQADHSLVIDYLSTNCGSCHNVESSIANLGLLLKEPVASHAQPDALLRPTSKWQIPHAPPGASRFVTPGAPDLSALLVRMRSRRPSSQMPPLGTVLHDREAIDLVTAWIEDLK